MIVAGVVALLTPFAVRPFLLRRSNFDIPNDRSSHVTPTLRGGGLATLVGWLAGGVVAAVLLDGSARAMLLPVVAAGAVMAAVGLVEDLVGVSALVRFGAQLVTGIALAATLCVLTSTNGWWVVVAAVGFAAYVNMANFMDGINGISGLHGGVVGAAYAVAGFVSGQEWLLVGGCLLGAVFLAFLPWNLLGKGMFLGDVGSYLLGAGIAALAIGGIMSGVSWLLMLAPLAVYLTDTVVTALLRSNHGEFIFDAHRTHAYQRLTRAGWQHLASSALVTLVTAACSALGLLAAVGRLNGWLAVAMIVVLVALYYLLPGILGERMPRAVNRRLAPVGEQPANPPRPGFAPTSAAVLGASGFVGGALAAALEADGLRVLRLPAPRLELPPSECRGVDVAARAAGSEALGPLTQELKGVDVVVNAAGLAAPDSPASAGLYGADALLPAVVALAADGAGAGRVLHLSSAAVQGSAAVLDAATSTDPFSPYSRAKALGEAAIFAVRDSWAGRPGSPDVIVVRATSVQGEGRGTTSTLQRIASSPLATVAAPGTQPTVVSSLGGLAAQVSRLARATGTTPALTVQQWEGLSVADALRRAGGREPRVLPRWFCLACLGLAKAVTRVVPDYAGLVRRIELMWLGQGQAVEADR